MFGRAYATSHRVPKRYEFDPGGAMRTYRWIWRTVAGAVLVTALMIGLVVLPFTIWLVLACLSVPLGLMLVVGFEAPDAEHPRTRRLHVVKLTIGGYLVVVASVVLVKFLGLAALAMFGLLLIGSPRALGWYGDRLAVVRSKQLPQIPASTSELCRQWLDSYDALSQASNTQARLRIVRTRQRCLDELERRDPDGLQAWLASSASAGSDPRRFLTDNSGGGVG
jgi:hypothetical protein